MSTSASPTTLDTSGLRELLDNGSAVRVIDVRTPGEFEAVHIPGSVNLPLDVLRAQDNLTVRHDEPIVLACASGARAEQARNLLESSGATQLRVLSGGVSRWEQDGGTVERGSNVWPMERQVRLTAGLLVLTGVLSSIAFEPLKWIAGFVGGGLTFAALSNTCAMSKVLALLPHNRPKKATDPQKALPTLTDRR
ncbi:rhodanese-like domain-containing protein [Saccharomonospora iraqiensis]|uniref:rhodanese-like domain-containing protein n=1 Tax=Saccharomonospora iraqiensis TaxID=52698 RepID=UPI00022E2B93|nr:rhodanese-like domain-containing protein [Saccharomonospora iraqiensis]